MDDRRGFIIAMPGGCGVHRRLAAPSSRDRRVVGNDNAAYTGDAVLDQSQLDEVTRRIRSVVEPRLVLLFGSQVTDSASAGSDIDVLVVVDDEISNLRQLGQMVHVAIGDLTSLPCDVLIEHESTFRERSKLPTIERTIAETGRTLYAA